MDGDMATEIRKAIGRRLQDVRKRSGMSQRELAGKIRCSAQFISDAERGISGLSILSLLQMYEALRCTLNDILIDGGQGERTLTIPLDGVGEKDSAMLIALAEAVIDRKMQEENAPLMARGRNSYHDRKGASLAAQIQNQGRD